MITVINVGQFADHFEEFNTAAQEFLPVLCYTPERTDGFIGQFAEMNDHVVCRIDHDDGNVTYYRYFPNVNMGGRSIQYLIPSNWEKRYRLLREALAVIKDDFAKDGEMSRLFLRVKEDTPSHNAYFMGLLPEFGFEITPRILMTAETDLVEQLALPDLLDEVEKIGYTEDRLADFIELFHQTEAAHETDLSDDERAQNRADRADQMTNALATESGSKCCTALAHRGKLIGFSFGQVWDDELSIEELGILPEYYGQGVGRYLTIRCMQSLVEHFDGPDRFFAIGTNRTNVRALRLYHRLGFEIDSIESYATLTQSD